MNEMRIMLFHILCMPFDIVNVIALIFCSEMLLLLIIEKMPNYDEIIGPNENITQRKYCQFN